jgi:N-acetylmuramoyl-L-alanine amidase
MKAMHRVSSAVRTRSGLSAVSLIIAAGMVLSFITRETLPEVLAAGSTANHFVVVIDPAHGGADLGSRFSATSSEKELTLAVARRLRTELQGEKIAVVLLRDSDVQLSADQRAIAANGMHASLFISIHAGLPGEGVRVFTSLLPKASSPKAQNSGAFLSWESAQIGSLERSKALAAKLVEALHRQRLAAAAQEAPLAPLNSVVAPAIAVELLPSRSRGKESGANLTEAQKNVVRAITSVVVSLRPEGERP